MGGQPQARPQWLNYPTQPQPQPQPQPQQQGPYISGWNSGAQAGFATLPATIGNTWRSAPAQQSTSYSMSPSYARSGMSYSTSYQQVKPDDVLIQRDLFTVNRVTQFEN